MAPIEKTAYGLTLNTLANGKVLALGGSANFENIADLTIDPYWWIFDPHPAAPTFTKMPATQRIAFHTATLLGSGCVLVAGGATVGGHFPNQAMLYWPDLVTLRITFQGSGAGSVSGHPASVTCTGSAAFQLAAGLQMFLLAEAGRPWTSTAWELVPASFGPLGSRRQRWTKVMVFHTNSFDGWGKIAPFDPTNPLMVVMDTNRSLVVNFGGHKATAAWPGYPHLVRTLPRIGAEVAPARAAGR